MVFRILQRLSTGAWPMVALFAILLLSLYLLGNFAGNVERFGRIYVPLLLLNALGLTFITLLIGINTWNLIRQFRQREAGARLTARLVTMFIIISLVPVTIVYSFSVQFLRAGIDSWFDVEVEQALDDALELSTEALNLQTQTLQRVTQRMARGLRDREGAELTEALDNIYEESGAHEIMLFSAEGRLLATRSTDWRIQTAGRPTDEIIEQVLAGQPYVGLDAAAGPGLYMRAVVGVTDSPDVEVEVEASAELPNAPLAATGPTLATQGEDEPAVEQEAATPRARLLQALYPVPDNLGALAASVQDTTGRYRELVFLREPLKTSYVLTLSLVLLLSVLTAVWAAFFSARRLMLPIHNLAEGTRAVAQGNYATRLPPSGRDELGFLVQSFNEMTRRLAKARDQARHSRLEVDSQRMYLEAVLERISTGVMTIDTDGRLNTTNEAASSILGLDLSAWAGYPLSRIAEEHPPLGQFLQIMQPHMEQGMREWHEEFELPGTHGRQIIVCRGTRLPDREDMTSGWVIVFDDITALVRAQREAAWSEVARRLAHEIRNPLTPIQLSAERLRQKFLEKLPEGEAQMLDRSTWTIIQQVEALKAMVRAFAEYAATPAVDFARLDLNALVHEVADLYRHSTNGARVELDLDPGLPAIHADRSRLRQVLHNLIKNAIEAQPCTPDRVVTLSTGAVTDNAAVELQVTDNGPGIAAELVDHLFEPYTTGKPRGSGLGLAIVKKIVDEHGGTVFAENRESGARITLRLPVARQITAENGYEQ